MARIFWMGYSGNKPGLRYKDVFQGGDVLWLWPSWCCYVTDQGISIIFMLLSLWNGGMSKMWNILVVNPEMNHCLVFNGDKSLKAFNACL